MRIEWFKVSQGGAERFLLAVHAGGPPAPLLPRAIVGQTEQDAGGRPDWASFRPGASFLEHFGRFMRGELTERPAILERARTRPGEYLYVIDPRVGSVEGDVPFAEIVGWYQTDRSGAPIGASFERNQDHRLVRADGTVSGVLREESLQRSVLAGSPA